MTASEWRGRRGTQNPAARRGPGLEKAQAWVEGNRTSLKVFFFFFFKKDLWNEANQEAGVLKNVHVGFRRPGF